MSFNAANFWSIGYGAGNAIWYYTSVDNLASIMVGTQDTGYFINAYLINKYPVRAGDLIVHNNAASKLLSVFSVKEDFTNNGATVIRVGGIHTLY